MNTTTISVPVTTSTVPVPQRRGWTARMTSRLGAFGMTAALAGGGLATVVPMMCAPAVSTPAATPTQQVVSLTNAQRAANSQRALTINAQLTYAAQAHANDQANRDTMTHTGSDGSNAGTRIQRSNYPVRNWGENVAAGYTDPTTLVNAWMASPTHRANIVSGNFTQIGVAVAYAADGTAYWAMELGSPQ
jgi:uncharacterized protein YkwD